MGSGFGLGVAAPNGLAASGTAALPGQEICGFAGGAVAVDDGNFLPCCASVGAAANANSARRENTFFM